MSLDVVSGSDPYGIFDPILMAWAERHRVLIAKIHRDCPVRSVWLHDRTGNGRAQMWLDSPDLEGNLTIIASVLDSSRPTKWGAREERHASLATLEQSLEELWPIMLRWGGPGAFS